MSDCGQALCDYRQLQLAGQCALPGQGNQPQGASEACGEGVDGVVQEWGDEEYGGVWCGLSESL